MAVAFLWGSADSVSAFAARRIGALPTTFFSQFAGLLMLFCLSALLPLMWESFTPLLFLLSALTGLFASVGYYTFYQGLAIGPITLVSTISSSSSILTLLLSFLLFHDRIAPAQVGALSIIILGVVLTSTNLQGLRDLLVKKRLSPVRAKTGITWAFLAAIAFSAMDLSIGFSSKVAGWFLPVLFMRIFSLLFLSAIFFWIRSRTRAERSFLGLSKAEPQALQRAAIAKNPGVPLSSVKQENDQALLPDDAMIKLSPAQLQKLRAAKKLDESIFIPPREKTRAHRSDFVDLPTLILSPEAIQNLRNADLAPTRTTLLSPANILPTRSASRLLSRPLDTIFSQPTRTITLPSTITTSSRPARIWGTLLAVGAGVLESIALLLFSRTTLVATTGIAAVLASNYSVVTVLVGLIAFRERLSLQQRLGMLLVFCGICLLALSSV